MSFLVKSTAMSFGLALATGTEVHDLPEEDEDNVGGTLPATSMPP